MGEEEGEEKVGGKHRAEVSAIKKERGVESEDGWENW